MRFTKISFALVALFLGATAQAQQKGRTQMDVQYNVAIPMGSFGNTITGTSGRGGQVSILYGLSDKVAIGLGTGFQDFYQKNPRQQYKLTDGSDLSAVRSFSIQTIPILAQAKYQFTPGATVQPYAALGVGGNLISYNDLAGEFTLEQKTKFGFAARPELGVFVPFKKAGETGFTLGASYNIMPFSSGAFDNLNNVGIHAGIAFPLRK